MDEDLRDLITKILAEGQRDENPATEFPRSGVDLVYHQLRVRLDVGATGEGDEVVVMSGKMLVLRQDPYVNDNGRKQIDFVVKSWEASGWSWTLKQVLTYVLSEDTDQPTSSIIAEQDDADFPATFVFNVIFDARVDNRTVFRQQHGKPEGAEFRAIPPNGDRRLSPTMRQFEDLRVAVEHPNLGKIEAIPLDCNDLGSRTIALF
jgi:hypothetical protein